MLSRHGIRREALLNLIALRALSASGAEETRKLQRYILGLALVALLTPAERFLREGCLLIPVSEQGAETTLVERTGKRSPETLSAGDALDFARAAANDFGVGAGWTAKFNRDSVVSAVQADQKKSQDNKEKKAKK